jgi:ribosome-associated protein
MIQITQRVILQDNEIEWQFVRSSGAGGQHINKVSTAAQLSFDIASSSLPEFYQQKLLEKADHRITKSGKVIIKCQQSRSQDFNRQTRRIETKKQRGATKAMRQNKSDY